MQLLSDYSVVQWLVTATDGDLLHWLGPFPDVYEVYVKIFHPIYVDLSIVDKEMTRNEWLLKHVPEHGKLGWREILRLFPGGPYERVRWAELCSKFGVAFEPTRRFHPPRHPRLYAHWPHYLHGPEENWLDKTQWEALMPILKGYTGEKKCYFYYSGLASGVTAFEARLFSGYLEELVPFIERMEKEGPLEGTPTLTWPDSREWCVYTNFDDPVSFVGGPSNLAERILAHEEFEAVEVGYSHIG